MRLYQLLTDIVLVDWGFAICYLHWQTTSAVIARLVCSTPYLSRERLDIKLWCSTDQQDLKVNGEKVISQVRLLGAKDK